MTDLESTAGGPAKIDFYVLQSSTAQQRLTYACRLTEKAYLRDLQIVVLTDSAADCELMDELLWTFNERSFVPHDLHPPPRSGGAAPGSAGSGGATGSAQSAFAAPVRLTTDLAGILQADLLVNLSDRMPAPLECFARIAEIIDGDAERRARGRERFKAYRDLKLPVATHQLDDAAGA